MMTLWLSTLSMMMPASKGAEGNGDTMRKGWLGGLRFGLIAGVLTVIGAEALAAVIWAAVEIGRMIMRVVR